jgi:hypothetical protein
LVASEDAEEHGTMLILGEWAFVKGDRVVIVWNRRGGGYATALVA